MKPKSHSFSITKKTKGRLPNLPFHMIKEKVLGKKYELSLVIVGNTLSRDLNLAHRKKNKPANVLSFPFSKTEGEIFLNPRVARKQAPEFGKNYTAFIGYLFIHGLLHLKGMTHGSKMEREEKKFCALFNL